MAKPTELPRWAETEGGTPASNIVAPNSGKCDTGYVTGGDIPTSSGLNWYMRLVYKWAQWLDAFAAADGTIDWSQFGAVGAILKSAVADGSSAIGHISDTVNALVNASSKLWSWKNHGVEKAYLDKGGRIVPAGIDLLASALQSILKGGTGGLDIGTSIATDLRILLNNAVAWTFRESDGALVSNGKVLTGLGAGSGDTDAMRLGDSFAVPTPVRPSLNAGWSNGYMGAAIGYWKDRCGVVHLLGYAAWSTGASSTMFTLPGGFRPAANRYFAGCEIPSMGDLGPATAVVVASSGTVMVRSALVNTNNYSLDGFTFLAE